MKVIISALPDGSGIEGLLLGPRYLVSLVASKVEDRVKLTPIPEGFRFISDISLELSAELIMSMAAKRLPEWFPADVRVEYDLGPCTATVKVRVPQPKDGVHPLLVGAEIRT